MPDNSLGMVPVILLILGKSNQTQAQPVPVLINGPCRQAWLFAKYVSDSHDDCSPFEQRLCSF